MLTAAAATLSHTKPNPAELRHATLLIEQKNPAPLMTSPLLICTGMVQSGHLVEINTIPVKPRTTTLGKEMLSEVQSKSSLTHL